MQVIKDDYTLSDPELAMKRGDNCTASVKQQMFRYNPGKTLQLFPPKHPYFPKGCAGCDRKLTLAYDPSKEKCRACTIIADQQRRNANKQLYERLKKNPDYTKVKFDEKSGGVKATHKGHNFDKVGGKYELDVQESGYKTGHAVTLENEKGEGRHTEGLWDGALFEVAGCETGSANNILRGLKHCASKLETEFAVIILPKTDFDKDIFETAIKRYKGLKKLNDGQYLKFKKIICIHKHEVVYTTDDT